MLKYNLYTTYITLIKKSERKNMIVKQVLYIRVFEGINKKSLILRTYNGKKLDAQIIRTNVKDILKDIEGILDANINEQEQD